MARLPASRSITGLAVVSAVVAVLLNVAATVAASQPASAQTQNRAGLVIRYANGSVATRCVTFAEESITGYELLRRAGIPFSAQVGGLGAAICKIGDDGCAYPAQSCFCKCEDPFKGCAYWIYGQWADSGWRYAGIGAVGRKVVNGQIDGWVWDVGQADSAPVRLPPPSLDEICSVRPPAVATSAPAATVAVSRAIATAAPALSGVPSPAASPVLAKTPTLARALPKDTPLPDAEILPIANPLPTGAIEPDATDVSTPAPDNITSRLVTPTMSPSGNQPGREPAYLAFAGILGALGLSVSLWRLRKRTGAPE